MFNKFDTSVLIAAALVLLSANAVHAEDTTQSSWERGRELGVLAGMIQPIVVDGGNLQLEGRYGRFVFDYSHGWSLDIPPVGDAKDQGLAMHVPYSTGMGLGYKLFEELDIRFEPKLHKFEISYDGGQDIVTYKTVTLGLGAYYSYRPFKNSNHFVKGITLAGSVRYWQNVWSSLDDDRYRYDNMETGRSEVHEAANIGIGNTPIIVNVSVGYVFSL